MTSVSLVLAGLGGSGGAASTGGNRMTCPTCAGRRLVEIGVTLQGKSVTLHSCSRCDNRWWDDEDGDVIRLDEVIDLATVRR
jgi:DNA-directed RNA polymerase subunit RPC12/RpoP